METPRRPFFRMSPLTTISRFRDHGVALTPIVASVVAAGLLGAASVVLAPVLVRGDGGHTTAEHPAPWRAPRAQIERALSDLVARSVDVLAIHRRGALPFTQFVLWERDDEDPGFINFDEVVVISHSRNLQTISVYRVANDEATADQATRKPSRRMSRIEIERLDFCDRWRADPLIGAAVIGRGVSDATFTLIDETASRSRRLRIRLIWDRESVDSDAHGVSVVEPVVSARQLKESTP